MTSGNLFSLVSVSIIFFFHSFPTFWKNKMFQARFMFLFSHLWNQPFSQEALVPFNAECYLKNQHLCFWCVHCYWGVIASRFSRWTELETNVHKYVHTYVCTLSMYIIIKPCLHTQTSSSITLSQGISYSTSFFMFVNFISGTGELDFCHLQYIYIFVQFIQSPNMLLCFVFGHTTRHAGY